jgi:hypothetical protein
MAPSKRFLLRLDPRLFDALRQWAADDLRSVNAQIEYLLADRARHAGRLPRRRSSPPGNRGSPDASGEDDPGGGQQRMARPGLEPGTPRFSVVCSTN